MGLFKRNGNWWISYFNPPGGGGKRIKEKAGPVKQDAETLLGVRRKEVNEGLHPELRRVRPVLFKDHAVEVLAKHYANKRSHSWAKLVIDKHLVPFFGDRWLGAIDKRAAADYAVSRLAEGVCNGTVNGEVAVLGKCLTLAVDWKILHDTPLRRREKLEKRDGRKRVLSHDEADKLIAGATKHLKPVIVMALETGGRQKELLGVKWDDIAFERGVLYFDAKNTKNGKQREIPLTPLLISTLRAIPQSIRSEYVFNRHGKRLRDVRTAWERARISAGLGEDVNGLHVCRHTFGTWYGEQPGANPFVLKELMGHADMKTTMGYFHGSSQARRGAVPLMGRQAGADCPRNVPLDGEQENQTA